MPRQFTGEFAAPELVTDFSNPDPDPNPGTPILAYDGLVYPNDGPAINGRNGGSGWAGPWLDAEIDSVESSISATFRETSLIEKPFEFWIRQRHNIAILRCQRSRTRQNLS